MTNKDDKQERSLSSGNPHDAYFKAVMGEARNAKDLIHKHLPKDITSQFSSDLPELVSGSFVDEALSTHLSDILYRVKLKAGNEAFVYTLIEHKSSPDALAPLQLLRYMVRIWSDWSKENKGSLPIIIPLIFYHGKRRWNVPISFAMLFEDVPESLQSCIPDFLYELVDLGQIEDQDLANDPRLAALLMPMKYIFTPKIILELTKTTENLLELEKMDFQLFLSYLIHARNDIGRKEVGKILNRLPSPEQEDIMAGLAQEWLEEGYSKGRNEGIAEGKVDGKAELLTELLENNFGSLSNDIKEKISKANADTVGSWFSKAIKASSLDDIFKNTK